MTGDGSRAGALFPIRNSSFVIRDSRFEYSRNAASPAKEKASAGRSTRRKLANGATSGFARKSSPGRNASGHGAPRRRVTATASAATASAARRASARPAANDGFSGSRNAPTIAGTTGG